MKTSPTRPNTGDKANIDDVFINEDAKDLLDQFEEFIEQEDAGNESSANILESSTHNFKSSANSLDMKIYVLESSASILPNLKDENDLSKVKLGTHEHYLTEQSGVESEDLFVKVGLEFTSDSGNALDEPHLAFDLLPSSPPKMNESKTVNSLNLQDVDTTAVPEKHIEIGLRCLFCKKHPEGVFCEVSQTPEYIMPNNIFPHCLCCKKSSTYDLEENTFRCIICTKRFQEINHLNAHIRVHTGRNHYECEYCHLKFDWEIHLKKHLRSHKMHKKWPCHKCGKVLGNYKEFNRHESTHVKVATLERPILKCRYCSRNFTEFQYLKRHLQSHIKGMAGCVVCGKKFTRNANLSRHMRRVHSFQQARENLIDKLGKDGLDSR